MRYLLGVGNYSMFDDSIGIKIIEYISEKKLDNDFQAIDLSGNALNLITYFDDSTKKIVIVDSGNLGLRPGEYKIFSPEEVVSTKELAGISSHEGDILKVIALGRETGYKIPEIKLFGIEPELIQNEFGLSPTLQERIPSYATAAISELNG